ncbi:hypothetical protein [Janthinobacterium lividum]|uniref:hypothetical protein n=1 Tax=Janthinobacterium lividum TaxID=29581 RepID=UPI001269E3E4|nr:hypothetical protein [Janthinobacterium lividum]
MGIAFRNQDGSLQALHLGWHHRLYCHLLDTAEPWVIAKTGLDDFSARIFWSVVATIPAFAPQIGYGTNWIGARGSFVQHLYSPPADSDGLTCATFVSEIFAGAGFDVIDANSWPINTTEALAWRADVVAALRETLPASPETDKHIANIESRPTVVRLRPAEIAGAATSDMDSWAIGHEDALEIAKQVLKDFAEAKVSMCAAEPVVKCNTGT